LSSILVRDARFELAACSTSMSRSTK